MEKVTVDVDVPQSVIQNLKTATITSNTTTSITPDDGYDGIRAVSVTTNVPSNNEIWTNKRFQTNNTYTISNLMNDNSKDGISKESTIVVDVSQLDVTQISNYPITSNGTQSVPIPSGYDAVDSISLNVAVNPKIEFDGFKLGDLTLREFSSFTKIDSNVTVDVPSGSFFINIVDEYQATKPVYKFWLFYNRTGSTVSKSLTYSSNKNTYYYYKTLISTNPFFFCKNGNDIFQVKENYLNSDGDHTQVWFYKDYVEIVGLPT